MKTNVQVKDEPVELQVNELLRLYGYNLTNQTSVKNSRTKPIVNQEQEPSTCAWCQKLGVRSFTLRTDNDDSKTLCSEVCFNQYRRASFKKNKGSESDIDHNTLPIISTTKNKSEFNNNKSFDKKNGTNKYEHQLNDTNRRKLILPVRRPTPTISKTKINSITRKLSSSPLSKRHRSSSSSSSITPPSNSKIHRIDPTTSLVSSNLPVSLTWQPSLVLPSNISWPPPVDINRFQYPFFVPPPPPPPLIPSLSASSSQPLSSSTISNISSDTSSSNLFTTLTKGTLSNFTCILPTFIPLPIPIPIPLCFPIEVPHTKCSIEVNNQQCQTLNEDNIHRKLTRRLSI
ncbi:unnamed protein product [Rotaria sp. Silwood1]|nr:unnamed protein product [Rotaria sp. Silwood1]CAF1517347.1 unnamed protein product [Rotaria sp. Silwood1]CAF1537439.1 unnamed protein product [Rotaria sp. Silwood1]CAF3586125.1 unnamed protein product [Rotaria sp. Silwood1]CAF3664580.1 unnamed protein product [Rotaria sp. Silwood1]